VKIEKKILQHLLFDDEYTRKVLPHLVPEYFQDRSDQLIFGLIGEFVVQYNKCPSIDAISIEIDKRKDLHNNIVIDAKQTLGTMSKPESFADDWLIDNTEEFCKNSAIYRAVATAAAIIEGDNTKLERGAIPKLLSDALSISFDTKIGHDFIGDAEHRWEQYHKKELKVPFDIDILNLITDGGVSKKTLNVLMAGTNVGKTMSMCHMAAANLAAGLNVLYITMEMDEIEIAKRIDVNLLDIPIEFIKELSKEKYSVKMDRIRKMTKGRLMIKEYPTGGVTCGNFRFLLSELKLKQGFIPDIIYIDYINLCMSERVKMSNDSYGLIKAVSEEIRGLAIQQNVPIISATQVNRGGFNNSDVGLENTSESFGLPMTADFMLALTADGDNPDQIQFKQLKSRYGDKNKNTKFMIGVDYTRMRLYQLEASAQRDIVNSNQTPTSKKKPKAKGGLFEDFK
jgi:replicative DNA helicase